jgi:hypothetical protein
MGIEFYGKEVSCHPIHFPNAKLTGRCPGALHNQATENLTRPTESSYSVGLRS